MLWPRSNPQPRQVAGTRWVPQRRAHGGAWYVLPPTYIRLKVARGGLDERLPHPVGAVRSHRHSVPPHQSCETRNLLSGVNTAGKVAPQRRTRSDPVSTSRRYTGVAGCPLPEMSVLRSVLNATE